MARFTEPTKEQERGWKEWVASRPDIVRVIAERFEPWSLYRMKSTGDRVTISSFSEDGMVTVNVTGEFNLALFDRSVFGVDPNDLEPCELPEGHEPTGTVLSGEEVDENIDALRALARPDLFVLDKDGRAKRKN